MPLSKKRMRERKRQDRLVKPKPMRMPSSMAYFYKPPVKPNDEFRWQDQGKQPIPNCPDGRYRENGKPYSKAAQLGTKQVGK